MIPETPGDDTGQTEVPQEPQKPNEPSAQDYLAPMADLLGDLYEDFVQSGYEASHGFLKLSPQNGVIKCISVLFNEYGEAYSVTVDVYKDKFSVSDAEAYYASTLNKITVYDECNSSIVFAILYANAETIGESTLVVELNNFDGDDYFRVFLENPALQNSSIIKPLEMDVIELVDTYFGLGREEFETDYMYGHFRHFGNNYYAEVLDKYVNKVVLFLHNDVVDDVTMTTSDSSTKEIADYLSSKYVFDYRSDNQYGVRLRYGDVEILINSGVISVHPKPITAD